MTGEMWPYPMGPIAALAGCVLGWMIGCGIETICRLTFSRAVLTPGRRPTRRR